MSKYDGPINPIDTPPEATAHWQDRVAQAINEGENHYRQSVLGQGPLDGYPVVERVPPSPDATAGEASPQRIGTPS